MAAHPTGWGLGGFMRFGRQGLAASALVLMAGLLTATAAAGVQKPKVRAITAFVKLDRGRYQAQIAETLKFLRGAKAEFEKGGYTVESLRITTQPFPEYVRGLSRQQALEFFHAYDRLVQQESFDANIGPAMMRDEDDPGAAELLAEVLSTTKTLAASIVVGSDDGIHWKAVRATAKLLKYVAEHSPHSQGNFSFAATAMLPPYAPFYPGSYHTGEGRRFSVATEGANVVEEVFAATLHDPLAAARTLREAFLQHAQALESLARKIEKESGWTYMGLDETPAPLRDVSIAAAIEKFTGAPFGSSGTMTAAALITGALRGLPIKQIGYSGLMVPVLEDNLLAQRWDEGRYNLDSLPAYSAVCGTGLDTIPLPGDISEEQLARILGDMATLAFKWKKPLSARLLPIYGKKAGDHTEFDDPFLTNATIKPLP